MTTYRVSQKKRSIAFRGQYLGFRSINRAKVPRLSVMVSEGQQQDSVRKNHPDQEELEAEIKLLKERNPKLLEVQEPDPPLRS